MSHNPVAATIPLDIQREAKLYSALYAAQHGKHLRYSCILWICIGACFLLLTLKHSLRSSNRRILRSLDRVLYRRSILGLNLHTTRLQALTIALFILVNTIFSFVDIPYGHSYRYVSKHYSNYIQKATALQFVANRTGYLAFANIPFVLLLVIRHSPFASFGGLSYKALNILHRVVGWTIFVLSWIHTLLWTIEMLVNYHNEDGYWSTRWEKRYWLGGFFASLFLTWIVLHSLACVRRLTGYEFFRNTHNLGTMLLLIGCWVHWPEECRWIAASLALYFSDRIARWLTMFTHYARARGRTRLTGEVYSDADGVDIAVVAISNSGLKRWKAGSHVYLYCISLGEWEPHPFSVANVGNTPDELKLIIRQKDGLTKELVEEVWNNKRPCRVLVDGPYRSLDASILEGRPLLMIAGGSGISFALSILYSLQPSLCHEVTLLWYIRRTSNLLWVKDDLLRIQGILPGLFTLKVRVTREEPNLDTVRLGQFMYSQVDFFTDSIDGFNCLDLHHKAPLKTVTSEIDEILVGTQTPASSILVCGPQAMTSEITTHIDHLQRTTKLDIHHHVEHFSA